MSRQAAAVYDNVTPGCGHEPFSGARRFAHQPNNGLHSLHCRLFHGLEAAVNPGTLRLQHNRRLRRNGSMHGRVCSHVAGPFPAQPSGSAMPVLRVTRRSRDTTTSPGCWNGLARTSSVWPGQPTLRPGVRRTRFHYGLASGRVASAPASAGTGSSDAQERTARVPG